MGEITSLINNVGFPIVACIFIFMQNKELTKSLTDLTLTLKGIDTRISNLERMKEDKQ